MATNRTDKGLTSVTKSYKPITELDDTQYHSFVTV